jgi:hypothetical protein
MGYVRVIYWGLMHGTVQAKLMNDFFVGRSLVSFHLKDAVLEGGFTFEKAHVQSIYQYNNVKDPSFGNVQARPREHLHHACNVQKIM